MLGHATTHRPARARPAVIATALVMTLVMTLVTPVVASGGDTEPAVGLGNLGEVHLVEPEVLIAPRSVAVERGVAFDVDVLALEGVPDDLSQVLAVLLEVTVAQSDVDGRLVAVPAGDGRVPSTSHLSFAVGRPTSALVVVRPSTTGVVTVALSPLGNVAGTAKIRASLVGWVASSSAADRGARLVTRPPTPMFVGTLTGDARRIDIRGRGGVPRGPSIDAAVVSLTVTRATDNTWLSGGPDLDGAADARTPTLVVRRGETATSTLAVVPLARNGSLTIVNARGEVDLAVQVVGFTRLGVAASSRAGRMVPLDRPFVVADTMAAPPLPLGAGQAEPWRFAAFVRDLTFAETGRPVGDVQAVIGTVTAFGHRRPSPLTPPTRTELRLYPDGRRLPVSAQIGLGENERRSTTSVVALSDDDVLRVHNAHGTTHYRIDLTAVVLE
jgi:hypothetical protein